MKLKVAMLLCFIICISCINAQDILTKKDGKKIEAIVKKVTKNNIKYVLFNDPNGVMFTIDKVLLKEVKFAYGKDLEVKNPENDANYYIEDKTAAYFFNFSAFSNNTLSIAYQKNLKLGHSFMAEAKVYGLGNKEKPEISRNGFGLDAYYRFKTSSLFHRGEFRPKHILNGQYVSPVIGFSTGNIIFEDFIKNEETSHTIFHFGVHVGQEWIIQRIFAIDASIGLHYYIGTAKNNYDYDGTIRTGNMFGSENTLLGFNLRIGFLAGKKFTKK